MSAERPFPETVLGVCGVGCLLAAWLRRLQRTASGEGRSIRFPILIAGPPSFHQAKLCLALLELRVLL